MDDRRDYARNYYLANRERIAERDKNRRAAWSDAKREKHADDQRRYRLRNLEAERERGRLKERAYRQNNPDGAAERERRYRERWPGRKAARAKRWRSENPLMDAVEKSRELLARDTGLERQYLPIDLVEARARLIVVRRMLRKTKAA